MAVTLVVLADPEPGLLPGNLARSPAGGVSPRRQPAAPMWGRQETSGGICIGPPAQESRIPTAELLGGERNGNTCCLKGPFTPSVESLACSAYTCVKHACKHTVAVASAPGAEHMVADTATSLGSRRSLQRGPGYADDCVHGQDALCRKSKPSAGECQGLLLHRAIGAGFSL